MAHYDWLKAPGCKGLIQSDAHLQLQIYSKDIDKSQCRKREEMKAWWNLWNPTWIQTSFLKRSRIQLEFL